MALPFLKSIRVFVAAGGPIPADLCFTRDDQGFVFPVDVDLHEFKGLGYDFGLIVVLVILERNRVMGLSQELHPGAEMFPDTPEGEVCPVGGGTLGRVCDSFAKGRVVIWAAEKMPLPIKWRYQIANGL